MRVSRLRDKSNIRRRLERDRRWALYALADLDDDMFAHSDWWAGPNESLGLVFRGLAITPIFVMGDAEESQALLAAMDEPAGYLNLLPHQLDGGMRRYAYRERHEMRRMFVEDVRPRAAPVEPLGPADEGEIQALYATGDGGGIAFAAFQLATGMFRGIRSAAGDLVAVAGVHVLSRTERVAGVGNIFTRPGDRGRGHAQAVTSAVVTALREAGIATIGLNVEYDNAAAIRAYERVGFKTTLQYVEGVAIRKDAADAEP